MTEQLVPIDHSAIRTHQAALIILLILAFILNQPWLVMLACAGMLAGALLLHRPVFGFLYTAALKPAGVLKPDLILDNREPHLFAQGVGGMFLLASSFAFLSGLPVLGWALSWIVTALAALNLLVGFCVGCAVYYWLNALKIPGFIRKAPQGTFPGMRPHGSSTEH